MFKFIKIEDPSRFLDQFKPLQIHPDDPLYIPFWRKMKKKCIEGLWFEDYGKWRYGRGNLGFYNQYCTIIDTDKKTKQRKSFRPDVRDLEWHRSYYILEAKGFSGFSEDKNYTSFREIDKIKKSELEDWQKEILLKPNGQFKEYVNAREYLFQTHDKPLGIPQYLNQTKAHVELGKRGGGKMAPLYTKLLSDKGWIKMGDVKLGDKLYDRSGNLTRVVGIHPQGVKQVWEISLKDGRKVECGDDHLWTVLKPSGKEVTISTKEMYESGLTYGSRQDVYKYRIPNPEPINFPEKDLPIDPYILGCLLGDGTITGSTPKIASSDQFIIDYFKSNLKGFKIEHDSSTTNNYTIVDEEKCVIEIIGKNKVGGIRKYKALVGNRLTQGLAQLDLQKNCDNKFIPLIYKESSVEQRMELIRGLIDTDGSVTEKGKVEFTNKNKQLINDLADVLRSLGIYCKIGIDNRENKHFIKGHECKRTIVYRLYINTTKEICKLPGKLDRLRNKKYRKSHDFVSIVDIQPLDKYEEQQCITVDNDDHTYIMDDYVVTHNSYYYALAEMKYNLCFAGLKSFDLSRVDHILNNLPIMHQNLGAAEKDKLLETGKKIEDSLDKLKTSEELGAYYLGEEGWVPNPFWLRMAGSYDPEKSEWTNKFRVKRGNEWEKEGEAHSIKSVLYSKNKRTGAQAGAGGRRDFILYEEIGLFEELITAWLSDEAVVSVEGDYFGVKAAIGTSGNIDTIESARKIFMHPKLYNCLEFTEFTDDGTPTCFFLADWMVDRRFKDKKGMTDEEAAIEYHKQKHEENEKSGDPDIINGYRVNNPHKPEHMWLSHEGNLLPTKEAEVREKQLLKNNLYEKLGTPVILYADPRKPEGVSYEVDTESKPILSMTDDNIEGAIMLYDQPFRYNGQIPQDAHFILHDPYYSEALDEGGSIGATIVLTNPKYITQGAKGNCIAMTYFGKHARGTDGYNRNLELICQFYGNPPRKLWYESNKGDLVRSYFIHPRRKKGYLLCLRPQFVQGAHLYRKNTPYTGFSVPNGVAKLNMITALNYWLLEETTLIDQETQKEETLANIFRIPDLLLIRQIKAYTMKGNFDTVSALLAAPLAIGEEEHLMKDNLQNQNRPVDNYTSKILKRYGKARTNIRSQNI